MKKRIPFVALALVLMLALSACGVSAEKGGYRTGYAVVAGASGSASATAEANGKAAFDVVFIGVVLDSAGAIVSARIDNVPASVPFTAEGKLAGDTAAAVASKQELRENYGMKAASGIGKEWYEQADALAAYVTGKTAEQIVAIDTGDADLVASVTINVDPYLQGLLKACENAQELGAGADDALSIASVASVSASKDAAADANGAATLDVTFAVVTKDGSGAITSAILDALTATVNFDAAGQITSDLSAALPTRNQLGANYGMKAASGLGLEWNEQAANFAKLLNGKNLEGVLGLDLGGADVISSATIHTDGFVAAVAKALG